MEQRNWLSPFNNDLWDANRFLSPMLPRYFNDFVEPRNFGPSVDLHETDKEIVLRADIPGVKQEDLDVTIDEHTVFLKGETKQDQNREEKGYHMTERRYGSFYRTVSLPTEVIPDQTVANYQNGVLELRIPKSATTSSRGYKPKFISEDKH